MQAPSHQADAFPLWSASVPSLCPPLSKCACGEAREEACGRVTGSTLRPFWLGIPNPVEERWLSILVSSGADSSDQAPTTCHEPSPASTSLASYRCSRVETKSWTPLPPHRMLLSLCVGRATPAPESASGGLVVLSSAGVARRSCGELREGRGSMAGSGSCQAECD